MGTVILEQASECVNGLMETLEIPSQKSASNLKKLILLSTDKESVTKSEKLLESLKRINISITESSHEISEHLFVELFETIKQAIVKTNSMFELVNKIFRFDGVDGAEVTIDDSNMYDFLSNMQKSKRLMEYILHYIKMLQEIAANGKGEVKEYSSSDLDKLFKVA